jgi:hypothetical protein
VGAGGCDSSLATRGEECTRSAQCELGLACIEGECSDNPTALGMQGQVPMLMPEPQDAGAAVPPGDAGVAMDAAQAPADAGTPAPSDAGSMPPTDAGAMMPADAGSMMPVSDGG